MLAQRLTSRDQWSRVHYHGAAAVLTWTDMSPGLLEAVRTATHLENASSNTWPGGGKTHSMRRYLTHTHTHTMKYRQDKKLKKVSLHPLTIVFPKQILILLFTNQELLLPHNPTAH